jgi:hypothetical protein
MVDQRAGAMLFLCRRSSSGAVYQINGREYEAHYAKIRYLKRWRSLLATPPPACVPLFRLAIGRGAEARSLKTRRLDASQSRPCARRPVRVEVMLPIADVASRMFMVGSG